MDVDSESRGRTARKLLMGKLGLFWKTQSLNTLGACPGIHLGQVSQ